MEEKGINSCGELGIRAVALPQQTDTYTVISHGFIIDKVREELAKNNFEIEKEEFLYSYGGQVVLGKVHIKSAKDPDMGMMFTWWNSYNKMVKFGCAIGAFIYDNNTSLIGSEGMSWIRKHTGTADKEASNIMEQLISQADVYFDKIIAEKERMKAMPLSIDTFGCIMGALYFELDLISPTQASTVKQEYKKPKHEYKDKDTLWGLYKLLMFGIDEMDLRKWAVNQQKIHYTIMNEYLIAEIAADKMVSDAIENEEIQFAPPIEQAPALLTTAFPADPQPEEVQEEKPFDSEALLKVLMKDYKVDKALAGYYCGMHFKANLSKEENVEAFFKYMNKPVPTIEPVANLTEPVKIIEPVPVVAKKEVKVEAPSIPEEIKEALINAPEVEVESTDTFVFPTDLDNPEKLQASIEQESKAVETKVPQGFEWLLEDEVEGVTATDIENDLLSVPTEVKELASRIETRMKELYGLVKPYNYQEVGNYCFVTLDETREVFYIQN